MASTPYSKMFDVEVVGGDQRTRLAEMLRANALNAPQGQMIGGWYVPPSWSQNLAHLANTAVGVFGGIAAEDAEREALKEDIQKYTAARQAQALRKTGQQPETPEQPIISPMYPSTPAAGRVEGGEFKAMKTGGMDGMPTYGVTQQQPQPVVDPNDVGQYKSRGFQKVLQQQQLAQLLAVPEYSQTPQYDQQGRAFVLDKQGNMKYLGSDQSPVRKMVDFNEPFIMNERGQWVANPDYQRYSMAKSSAGATRLNIPINTEKTYGGAMAGEIAKLDVAKYNTAAKAPQVLENVARTKAILSEGNVLTGALANPQQAVLAYGQALGVTGKDTNEILSNTQMLAAARAGATLDAISASGLGSGQGFSNKDREFLEQAKLGNVKYTRETLLRQADLEERVARESVKAWNTRLQQIPASSREPLGLQPIELPEAMPGTSLGAPQGPRLRRGQR